MKNKSSKVPISIIVFSVFFFLFLFVIFIPLSSSVSLLASIDYTTNRYPNNNNLCRTPNGDLHGYISGDCDPTNCAYYINSSDNGLTWSSSQTDSTTMGEPGMLCKSNGYLTRYGDQVDIKIWESNDGGATWESPTTISTRDRASCVLDSNDNIHCVFMEYADDSAHYANSSNWATEYVINNDPSDDSDKCSIGVNSSDCVFIACAGNDQDDIDIWSDCLDGWGSNNRIEMYNGVAGAGESDLQIENENLYVVYVDSSDIILCNSTTGDPASATCNTIRSFSGGGVQYPAYPDLAVNSNEEIVVIYGTNTTDTSSSPFGSVINYSKSTDGITFTEYNLHQDGWTPKLIDTSYGTSSNFNNTIRYIYVDSNNNLSYDSFKFNNVWIVVDYPLNTNYSLSSLDFNLTVTADAILDSCWYTLNSGVKNYTMSNTSSSNWNATNLSIGEGTYKSNFYCNDTNNVINDTESVSFTIDTTNPDLNITFPINNTNSTNNQLNINFTISDTNLDSCWYSNDSYGVNTSLASCGNITDVIWNDGTHNVRIYANDSAGNENISSITFTIDSSPPNITINYPVNGTTYTSSNINFNITVTDSNSIDECLLNLNDDGNISMDLLSGNEYNYTNSSLGEGDYNVTFYCNDSFGNLNNTEKSFFTISFQAPSITLDYPSNNSFLNYGTNVYFNYTATDDNGLSVCELWADFNGSYSKNYTWTQPQSGTQNHTNLNLTDGTYLWSIWCNDTQDSGNFNDTNYTLTIDTTLPVISEDDIDITTDSQTVTFNVTNYTEINCDSAWYSVYLGGSIHNSLENESLTSCDYLNDTFAVLSYDAFVLRVYMNDSAGNENSTNKSFTTSESTTTPSGGGGGGTSPTTQVIAIKQPPNISIQSGLSRAILFIRIRNACNNESICNLNIQEFNNLNENLLENVPLKENELDIWIDYYNEKEFESVKVLNPNVEKYGLFTSLLEIIEEYFKVNPSRIDKFWFILSDTIEELVESNRILTSCEVTEGELGWNCSVTNSTALITYKLPSFPPKWSNKEIKATISYTSKEGENTFQTINIRAIHLQGQTSDSIPVPLWITLIALSSGFIIIIYYRKNITKRFKKLRI